MNQIATRCELPIPAVRKYLSWLEQGGLVVGVPRFDGSKQTIYRLTGATYPGEAGFSRT